MINGCTQWGAFFKSVLPQVKGGLAATALFVFVLNWSDYLIAKIMTQDEGATAPVYLQSLQGGASGNEYGLQAALAMLLILPPAIFGLAIQRYLVRGLTFGAIKRRRGCAGPDRRAQEADAVRRRPPGCASAAGRGPSQRGLTAELLRAGSRPTGAPCGFLLQAEGLSFKKNRAGRRAARPDIARKRARWRTHQARIDAQRLVFIDETWIKTNMAPLRGWGPRGQRLVARCRTAIGRP